MKAMLALANGATYVGQAFGAPTMRCAELVFNTAMTGYQEVLTDPSYQGQCVVLTAPMVGVYAMSPESDESGAPALAGLIVRELCVRRSPWNGREALGPYLARHGIPGISGIDTRALVRQIRTEGRLHAALAAGDVDPDWLVEQARRHGGQEGRDIVQAVTTPRRYTYASSPEALRVAVLDCGVKTSILRMLAQRGTAVEVFPASATATDLLAAEPDGVLLSNGPGDPAAYPEIVATVRSLIGRVPLFGICLGHQLLGLALGAKSYPLPFGHHGANHPVRHLSTGQVMITAQNHTFALRDLDASLEVTHVNLLDGTIEGMRHRSLPLFSVQFHPEAAPGPHDAIHLFDQFLEMMHQHRMRMG